MFFKVKCLVDIYVVLSVKNVNSADTATKKLSFFFFKYFYTENAHPSPDNAQQACICHWCFLILVRSSCLLISAADIAPWKQKKTTEN